MLPGPFPLYTPGGGYGIQGSPSTGWRFFRPAGTASTERIASFGIGVTEVAFIRGDGVLDLLRPASASTLGDSRYLKLSDSAGSLNGRTEIGWGYPGASYQPAVTGFLTTSNTGNTKGSWYVATRDVTTDTAPTERVEVESNGDVNVGTTMGDAQVNIKASADSKGAISLEANGASTSGILFDYTGNYGFIDYNKDSSQGIRISALSNLRLGTNTNTAYGASTFTEAARVTSSSLTMSVPLVFPSYTLGTLPAAASFTRAQIWVSDMTGGAQFAYSDGTNWRRVSDNTVAS